LLRGRGPETLDGSIRSLDIAQTTQAYRSGLPLAAASAASAAKERGKGHEWCALTPRRRLCEIRPLRGNHATQAPVRIGHVIRVARDGVHVRWGPAGGRAAVEVDVVAVRLAIQPFVEEPLFLPYVPTLPFPGAPEEPRHNQLRDHGPVLRRHRMTVEDRESDLICTRPLRGGQAEKGRDDGV
jgi:hypothetical protein